MNAIDDLVRDYLARLDAASGDLPPDLRDELRADVRSHLDEVTSHAGSEAAVRQALDRLGSPEAIVRAARDELDLPMAPPAPTPTAPPATVGPRGLDLVAVLLLLFGGFLLPGIGWLFGVVLLWASPSWRFGEKLLGTLVWPGGLLAPALLGLFGWIGGTCTELTEIGPDGTERIVSTSCDGMVLSPWLGRVLLVVAVTGPVLVATFLLRRAAQRRRQGADVHAAR